MQEGQSLLREHSGSSAAGGGAHGVAMGTPAAPAAGNTRTAAQLSEALAEQRRLSRPIVLEFGTSSLPALPRAAQRRGASLHAPAVPGRQSRGSGPGSQGVGTRGKAPHRPSLSGLFTWAAAARPWGRRAPGEPAGTRRAGGGGVPRGRPHCGTFTHLLPRPSRGSGRQGPCVPGASPAARHGGVAHRRAGGSAGMNPHGSEVAVWAGEGFWVEPRGRHACPCV